MAYVKPEKVEGEDFLFVRAGKRGVTYQYIRAVPASLAPLVGRTIWQESLGSDLPTARRKATERAMQHDQLTKGEPLRLAKQGYSVVPEQPSEPFQTGDWVNEWVPGTGEFVRRATTPEERKPIPWATPEERAEAYVPLAKPELPDVLATPPEKLADVMLSYQRALRDWQEQNDMQREMAPLTAALGAKLPPGTVPLRVTLDSAVEAWLQARSHRASSRRKIERVMARFRESVGARTPIASIAPEHVEQFISTVAELPNRDGLPMHYRSKPMAFLLQWRQTNKGVAPITPATVRDYLRTVSAMMQWSVTKYRLPSNPCTGLGGIIPKDTRPKATRHVAAIDWREGPAFVSELSVHVARGDASARAMLFCILTLARKATILKARWSEIDIGSKQPVWTVPAANMKTNEEHRVPLPRQAIAVLGDCGSANALVFGKLRDDAMGHLRRSIMGKGDSMTEHGWRSAFVAFAGNHVRASRDLAQLCLAHKVGDAVERAYMRDTWEEQRAELLQAWADYLLPPAS